jgi:HAD superfamily hydrolase (TIGR01509 family)
MMHATEPHIRAVLFDLDGTLVDNMPYHIEAWIEIGRELGVALTPERVQRDFSGRLNDEILRGVLRLQLSDAEVRAWAERKELRYRELYGPRLRLLDGADALLDRLRARGIACGIASAAPNANRAFVLDGLGLRARVGAIVGGEEVARGKPAPDLFLEGARRLAVAVEKVLVFEDAVLGVQAARAAGMRVCGITTAESAQSLAAAGAFATAANFRMLPEPVTQLL